MSAELRSLRSCTAFITPSTTISGSLPAVIDREPRMRMEVPSVGSPETLMMSAPATRPCRAWSTERVGELSTSCILTVATDPVRSCFFCSPKPMTTNSSRKVASSSRVMSNFLRLPTFILTVLNPSDSKTRTASSEGTLRENLPAPSVTVPTDVPSADTVAPGSALPPASTTEPVTWTGPCAWSVSVTISTARTARHRFNINNQLVKLLGQNVCTHDGAGAVITLLVLGQQGFLLVGEGDVVEGQSLELFDGHATVIVGFIGAV